MNVEQLKQELYSLFGEEKVYFRNDGKNDAISKRFEDSENSSVICFLNCEGGTEKILDYYESYSGDDRLAKIKYKYNVNHDWETNCIAYLCEVDEGYYDSDSDSDNDSDSEFPTIVSDRDDE